MRGRKKGLTSEMIRQKIIDLLKDRGARRYQEIAKETRLHRNTIGIYMKGIEKLEKFFYDRNGKMRVEPDWIQVLARTQPEILAMLKEGRVTATHRLTVNDLKRYSSIAFEGDREGRQIGAIFQFAQPQTPIDIGSIFSLHVTEFLSENPYWLRDIFRYALREKLIDDAYFSGDKEIENISNEELERLWSRLFGEAHTCMIFFSINPQKLLRWIRTEGREDLKRALSDRVRREFYDEFLKRERGRGKFSKHEMTYNELHELKKEG